MRSNRKRGRIFLLSPANCSGRRAEMLLRPGATFDLAVRLQKEGGAPLGEVFSFLSGLYFRGKLRYATHFGKGKVPSTWVITAGQGLLSPETAVTAEHLRSFASVPIDVREPRYRVPLERDIKLLANNIGDGVEVVLLGSIATPKYREVLMSVLGEDLCFPLDFIGRGDMSRGGLLLRCVAEERELAYVTVSGATLHGARPSKLVPHRKQTDGRDQISSPSE